MLPPVERPEYEEYIASLVTRLSEAAFADLWAEGKAMSLDQLEGRLPGLVHLHCRKLADQVPAIVPVVIEGGCRFLLLLHYRGAKFIPIYDQTSLVAVVPHFACDHFNRHANFNSVVVYIS